MKIDNTIAAVVTGGASGLGRASAQALAAAGVKVAIFDISEEAGEAFAKEIGGIFCNVDIMSEESVEAGFAKARAVNGQERVVVHCAVVAGGGKGAVNSMVLPMARDLMDLGIRVNAILPGTFATPPMLKVKEMNEAIFDGLSRAVPFPKRFGKPEEFGSLVMELTRNAYFNGQLIRLDGAIRMPPK